MKFNIGVTLFFLFQGAQVLCYPPSVPYSWVCSSNISSEIAKWLHDSVLYHKTHPCVDADNVCEGVPSGQYGEFQKANQRKRNIPDINLADYLFSSDPPVTKLAKHIYRACERFVSNTTPVFQMINEFGGWPLLENSTENPTPWTEKKFKWENYFSFYADRGLIADDFFHIIPTYDYIEYEANRHEFRVQTKPRDNYTENIGGMKESKLDETMKLLQAVLTLFKIDANESQKAIDEYVKFSHKLLCAKGYPENIKEGWLFNIENDNELYGFPWATAIGSVIAPYNLIGDTNVPNDNFLFKTNIYIKLDCLECFKEIVHVVKHTSSRTIYNYLMLRFVLKTIPFYDASLTEMALNLETIYKQAPVPTHRKQYCGYVVKNCFLNLTAYDYMERNNIYGLKYYASDLAESMREVFMQILLANEWFEDYNLKRVAEAKIGDVRFKIGYPNHMVRKHYHGAYLDSFNKSGIKLGDPAHYFSTILLLNRISHKIFMGLYADKNLNEFRDDFEQSGYLYGKIRLNHKTNSLHIPAPYLQGILFGIDRPLFVNYATLGPLIGYALAHAVIGEGTKSHVRGYKLEWLASDYLRGKYVDRVRCFEKQLRKYKVDMPALYDPGENINITHYICAREGLAVAYKAFELDIIKNLDKHESALTEDYITEDAKYLFWIIYMKTMCPASTIGSFDNFHQIVTTLIAVLNIGDFYTDMKCDRIIAHSCSMYYPAPPDTWDILSKYYENERVRFENLPKWSGG